MKPFNTFVTTDKMIHAGELGLIIAFPSFIVFEDCPDKPRVLEAFKNNKEMAENEIVKRRYNQMTAMELHKLHHALTRFISVSGSMSGAPAGLLSDFLLGMIDGSQFHYNKMYTKNLVDLSDIFRDNEENIEIFDAANKMAGHWDKVKIEYLM